MPIPDEPAGKTGKLSLFYKRHEMKITRAEVVIIFLALIRTITAYYQLKTRPASHPAARHNRLICTQATERSVQSARANIRQGDRSSDGRLPGYALRVGVRQ